MLYKKISIALLLVLVSLFLISAVSALTLNAPTNDLTLGNKQTSVTLTADPNNSTLKQTITLSLNPTSILQGSNQVLLKVTPISFEIAPNTQTPTTKQITISVDSVIGSLKFGRYTSTLSATDGTNNATQTINFVKSFCKSGSVGGNLTLNSIDISSSGDQDDEWKPLDKVDVEVEVANDGDNDIKDIFVELALFDSQGRNNVNDLDFENADEEKIDLGRLNDGDEETVTFTFRVPPDFDAGSYKLAVKAYSDDLGENVECADTSDDLDNTFFEDIDVSREDDEGKFIAFDNIKITPSQIACGDTVTLDADVFNVGDEDQDQVRITLSNSELNLNLQQEIREDLNEGDKSDVTFTFTVPTGVKEKLYSLALSAEYDYRNGNYRQSSDDETKFGLNVVNCESAPSSETGKIAAITASLDSDAKAGKELVVKSTITNLLSNDATFIVSASGYESWADIGSISERILNLKPKESADVELSFNVNDDVSDEQSFTLEVRSGDKLEAREIKVNIEPAEKQEQPTFTGLNLGGNGLIWVIGIINVILIILIIIVAVRVSRR